MKTVFFFIVALAINVTSAIAENSKLQCWAGIETSDGAWYPEQRAAAFTVDKREIMAHRPFGLELKASQIPGAHFGGALYYYFQRVDPGVDPASVTQISVVIYHLPSEGTGREFGRAIANFSPKVQNLLLIGDSYEQGLNSFSINCVPAKTQNKIRR